MAERLKAPVLKTGDPKGFQSSNLCASARLNKGLPKGSPFVFLAVGIVLVYSLGIFPHTANEISHLFLSLCDPGAQANNACQRFLSFQPHIASISV